MKLKKLTAIVLSAAMAVSPAAVVSADEGPVTLTPGLFHESLVQNKGIISAPDTVSQTQSHYSRHKKAQNTPKTYLQIF